MAGSSTDRDQAPSQPAFYFDLRSPEAYLAAEQVNHVLPEVPEWIPVLSTGLPGADPLTGWHGAAESDALREDIERRAAAAHLQALRWPDPFPFDAEFAMRAAWYAKSIGRAVAFALAAFRQAFAGGRALSVTDNVLIAASACEMHPTAVLKGAGLRSIGQGLQAATDQAVARGVRDVPALWLPDGRVFHGEPDLRRAGSPAP